ncbi:unnamed protein product [Rangifer tarandus platyrhynchus]|uniref:Uncharacterized protein n=1 Tax=Rangifer tarandus platyrhynchus TaxID=3082113 RepID=A0AC59YTC1_RANTA
MSPGFPWGPLPPSAPPDTVLGGGALSVLGHRTGPGNGDPLTLLASPILGPTLTLPWDHIRHAAGPQGATENLVERI